jgi:hypothetical protein
MADICETIQAVDSSLTLEGLRIIYEKMNTEAAR